MEKEYIILKESTLGIYLGDAITMASLCGAVWFNQTYCGGSYFLNAVILIMGILTLAGYAHGCRHRFTTKEAAIKWLQQ